VRSFLCLPNLGAHLHIFRQSQGRLLRAGKRQAITRRWADGQEPECRIVTQHRADIATDAPVIDRDVVTRSLHGLFAEFDGSHGFEHQPDVKAPEAGDQDSQEACKSFAKEQKEHREEGGLSINGLLESPSHCPCDDVGGNDRIKKEQEEELVVAKANAVVDPRTVVVHLENAHAADPAVVTAVRLVLRAPLTVPTLSRALGLVEAYAESGRTGPAVLRREVPRGAVRFLLFRDSARMRQNALHIADEQHYGRSVKDDHLCSGLSMSVVIVKTWQTMVHHVDCPKSPNLTEDESHWQELRGLREAALARVGVRHGIL